MAKQKLDPKTVQQRITQLRMKINQIQDQIKTTKLRCKHKWTYLPDPSGNNDSEYVCYYCETYQKDPK